MIDVQIRLPLVLRTSFVCCIQRCFQTVSPGEIYCRNWHLEAIAWALEQCRRGLIKRLIICLPPRSLKSIAASVAFPAWLLGHDPAAKIICASYSSELAAKHARDNRAVMEARWYRGVFPWTRIDPAKNAELEFMTTRRGFRYATSVGGTLTGRGGNCLIIDDPLKPGDALSEAQRQKLQQWFDGTLYSRLDDKAQGVIIVITQRLHVDDLVGHLLETGEDWTVLELPAIAEAAQRIQIGPTTFHERRPGELLHLAREDRETLERIKRQLGSQLFSAQYQQAPVPPGGALIKWDWIKRYRQPPPITLDDLLVLSVDTASKAEELNDYSVGTLWLVKERDYYLMEVWRERLEYPELRRRVTAKALAYPNITLLIEEAGAGLHLVQDLRSEGHVYPIAIRPLGDKLTRMAARSALIEAGHVHLPEAAPWLADFQAEVMAFPHGRHDDQVDSMAQFLNWIEERRANRVETEELLF